MTFREDLLAKLTNRQREVLNLLAERFSDSEIKRLLDLAEERKLDTMLQSNISVAIAPTANGHSKRSQM